MLLQCVSSLHWFPRKKIVCIGWSFPFSFLPCSACPKGTSLFCVKILLMPFALELDNSSLSFFMEISRYGTCATSFVVLVEM